MKFLFTCCLAAITLSAADDWKLYLASIAAADGALRLHETSAAKRWLVAAPEAHRDWEWRYLNALADESTVERKAHDAPITGLAIDSTGRFLATTSGDRTVKLWDARNGAPYATLEGHTSSTWTPSFRPGSTELATMGSDGTVRIWNYEQKKEVQRFAKLGNGLGAVAWSPDGQLLAAGTWSYEKGRGVVGWLYLWRFPEGELLWKKEYGVKPIPAIAIRNDSKQLAAATWDGWVGLFSIPDGKLTAEAKFPLMEGTYPAMQSVVYSLDGKQLAATSKDGVTRVFNSTDAKMMGELPGHTRWVNTAAYNGSWLATGSSDETIRLWDSNRKLIRVLHGHTAAVHGLAVTPDQKTLISAASDGTLRWWDAANLTDLSHSQWRHPTEVYGFAFSRDGTRAASAGWGGGVKLWDVANGVALWDKPIHGNSANAVSFSPDGERIISGGNDGKLQLLEARTGNVLATWEEIKDGRAAGIAWSADGRTVFSPSSRPTGKLWDAATGKLIATITGGRSELYNGAFSPDSRWVACAWLGGEVKVFDARTGTEAATMAGHTGGAYAVAFHPNGRIVASAGSDRKVRLWEMPSGKLLRTLEGHSELIYGIDFSADGKRLVSASTDHTVRLWSTDSGEQVLSIPFPVQVYGVKFSPKGQLAVLPMNGTIRLLGPR